MPTLNLEYKVTATTLRLFHACRAYVRCVSGPLGSGKSVAMCWELFNMMINMPPCKDGVRRSRYCMVRDTATNLHDTTMQTWLKNFPARTKDRPEGITIVHDSPPYFMEVRLPHPDGKTFIESLIYCRHQSCDADAEDIKGLELSGGLVDEANMVPRNSVRMLVSRIGRYPDKKDLALDANGRIPIPRFGLVMSTNMPDDQHWWYELAEVIKPKGWAFFRQPPAMFCRTRPDGKIEYYPNVGQKLNQGILPAENIENHNEGWDYYRKAIAGNSHDWIRVNIMAEYGNITSGRPVYPDYSDLVNYIDKDIAFDRGKTLFLGFDWGLTPSVVFLQMSDQGQLQVIDEIDGNKIDNGIEILWENTLRPKLMNDYGWGRGTQIFAVGDPAGEQRNQVTGDTCIRYLGKQGLTVVPSHVKNNDIPARLGAVNHFLHRTVGKGLPALLLSKRAQMLRAGFSGKYYFARQANKLGECYTLTPCKDKWSHIHDAMQYICHALKNPDEYGIDWRNKNDVMFGDKPLITNGMTTQSKSGIDMSGFM